MNDKKLGPMFYALNDVAGDCGFEGRFIAQRGNIPQCYNRRDDITVHLSKAGIEMLSRGDVDGAKKYRAMMLSAWWRLKELDVPGYEGLSFDADAAQEMIEYFVVLFAYPLIFGGEVILEKLPTPYDFSPSEDNPEFKRNVNYEMTFPAWLAGVADAPGELGKMVQGRLLDSRLTFEDRVELLERLISASKEILFFLEQFIGVGIPDYILNSSRRKGFYNTYRGKLFGVVGVIRKNQEELTTMKNLASIMSKFSIPERKEA